VSQQFLASLEASRYAAECWCRRRSRFASGLPVQRDGDSRLGPPWTISKTVKGDGDETKATREIKRPPVPLRLTLPGELAFRLDSYRHFVRENTGRDMETKELALKMLSQFLESDKAFRRFLAIGLGDRF